MAPAKTLLLLHFKKNTNTTNLCLLNFDGKLIARFIVRMCSVNVQKSSGGGRITYSANVSGYERPQCFGWFRIFLKSNETA